MPDHPTIPFRRPTVRHFAGALLISAGLLDVVALHYQARHPLFGYLRAFAEAGLVGGLADWFAVSALFRHPLGLPIPHTAIVPRNKDRIGAALGGFVERNFLDPAVVRTKLADLDCATLLADWLEQARNRALLVGKLAELLPTLLDSIDDDRMRRLIGHTVRSRLQRFDLAPLGLELFAALIADERHQELVDELLRQAAVLLKENEAHIRQRVSTRTAWLWRKLSVGEQMADQLIEAVEEALAELATDKRHPWRQRVDAALEDYLRQLAASPDYQAQADALKQRLLQHPGLLAWLDRLWPDIEAALRADAARPASALRGQLRKGLALLAGALRDDVDLRTRLNGWALQVTLELVNSRRHEVSKLIADTVRGWDGATMAGKIEQQIGDDLQYIRINGTVVGGLAGLLLHLLTQLAA